MNPLLVVSASLALLAAAMEVICSRHKSVWTGVMSKILWAQSLTYVGMRWVLTRNELDSLHQWIILPYLGITLAIGCGTASIVSAFLARYQALRIKKATKPGMLGCLADLRWLLGGVNREQYDLVLVDLERDRKGMLKEGFQPGIIYLVILWRFFCSVLPIAWDNFTRILKALAGAAESIHRIIGRR